MTLIKKLVTVPAQPETTREVDDGYSCDFCGKRPPQESVYETEEARLSATQESSYPDSGMKNEYIVDCCYPCWQSVVVPWLASKGITPRIEHTDW